MSVVRLLILVWFCLFVHLLVWFVGLLVCFCSVGLGVFVGFIYFSACFCLVFVWGFFVLLWCCWLLNFILFYGFHFSLGRVIKEEPHWLMC